MWTPFYYVFLVSMVHEYQLCASAVYQAGSMILKSKNVEVQEPIAFSPLAIIQVVKPLAFKVVVAFRGTLVQSNSWKFVYDMHFIVEFRISKTTTGDRSRVFEKLCSADKISCYEKFL